MELVLILTRSLEAVALVEGEGAGLMEHGQRDRPGAIIGELQHGGEDAGPEPLSLARRKQVELLEKKYVVDQPDLQGPNLVVIRVLEEHGALRPEVSEEAVTLKVVVPTKGGLDRRPHGSTMDPAKH